MRSKIASTAVATIAAAGFVTALSAPAHALTWTASPGGAITGSSVGQTQLKDLVTNAILRCNTSSAAGSLATSDADGVGLGTLTTVSFSNCSVGAFTFTVSAQGLPWSFNAVSYNAGTGVTTGTITGARANLTGPLCSAKVGGPGGPATPGTVNGSFTNSTDRLASSPTAPGGNLTLHNVVGCGGLIGNGHAAQFIATYQLSPGQTVTSP